METFKLPTPFELQQLSQEFDLRAHFDEQIDITLDKNSSVTMLARDHYGKMLSDMKSVQNKHSMAYPRTIADNFLLLQCYYGLSTFPPFISFINSKRKRKVANEEFETIIRVFVVLLVDTCSQSIN
jgi:hypothetical protein